MADHPLYIKRCLELGEKGKGFTAPNPMVGAVLVHEGRIIGEGFHRAYGQAHAEVHCLESVKEEDRHLVSESTMYVSLEPCAHYGHTPPCALRLVQENVKEVVVCNADPFEQVQGKGFAILKENGIPTQSGILEQEGQWLNRRFFCFHRQKRPYIILKWAQTAEGFFAPPDRSRVQMSNPQSRQLAHKWRTEEAAIMVGYHTALSDDPQLTARLWEGRQPLRIVLDRQLQLPGTLHLFDKDANTWIINEQKEQEHEHIQWVQLDFNQELLPRLMKRLHQANRLSLIVEGGAKLLDSFIGAGLWDEARVFSTGSILPDGIPAPHLTNADRVLSVPLDTDLLNVYTNRNTAYPYASGMAL